jgi:chromosome partitioning protein
MKESFDVIFIDAGGRDGHVFRSALMASDLVVIPLLPSQYDIWAARDSLEILKEARVYRTLSAVFLFNQVIMNTNIAKEASEALQEITIENDIKLLKSTLYSRVAYKQSISKGLGVSEYEPTGKAAQEVRQAYKEIMEVLKHAK